LHLAVEREVSRALRLLPYRPRRVPDINVRVRQQSGTDMLAVSISPFDPSQTSGERIVPPDHKTIERPGVRVFASRSMMAKPKPQSQTRPDEMAHGQVRSATTPWHRDESLLLACRILVFDGCVVLCRLHERLTCLPARPDSRGRCQNRLFHPRIFRLLETCTP
jgi:hypothetical protein